MSSPHPRERRGQHAQPARVPARVWAAVVVTVVVLAAAGYVVLAPAPEPGVQHPGPSSPPVTAGLSPTDVPLASGPSPSMTPTATRPVLAPPAPSASATPRAVPTSPRPSGTGGPTPQGSTTPSEPRPQVVVLNQTTRRGLAARVAAALERAGWTVSGVGNFRGVVPSTTVYHPPGRETWARRLARDVGTQRVRPAFSTISDTELTVVLTRSYDR